MVTAKELTHNGKQTININKVFNLINFIFFLFCLFLLLDYKKIESHLFLEFFVNALEVTTVNLFICKSLFYKEKQFCQITITVRKTV